MKKITFAFLFSCIGIAAEILFTGIKYNIFLPLLHHETIHWALSGTSYIWMFFIYGAIPFVFPPVYQRLRHRPAVLRWAAYACICLSIEFICGGLLDLLTGACPWEYTTPYNIAGYIRLDYFPVWMLFGWGTEKIWLFLHTIIR